jgi:NADPH-dependent curcumin reductase CurA
MDMLRAAAEHLAPGGRLVIVGYISGYPHVLSSTEAASSPAQVFQHSTGLPHFPESAGLHVEEIFWGRRRLEGAQGRIIQGDVHPVTMDERLAMRARVLDLYRTGEIQVWVDPVPFVGLESVAPAVAHMLSGKSVGKVVVTLPPPGQEGQEEEEEENKEENKKEEEETSSSLS